MAPAGPLAASGMPGDLPADFAALLAGLLGMGEAAQAGTPEGVLTSSVESMTDDASEAAPDSLREGAMPVLDISASAAAAPLPLPLTVPDLLAQMVPPPQPIPAMPEATPAEAATAQSGTVQGAAGQGTMNPLGLAPSASPSPANPAMPDGLPPDPAMLAVSEPHRPASQVSLAIATEAPEAPGVQVAAAAPVPPATTPADPRPQADMPHPMPAAAPLAPIAMSPEPSASAPIATATEPPPMPALPDPRQPASTEAMAAAPDTSPASATGGVSANTLATPAPEPPAAPARPTAPIPWPARQVVPFAVSLALGSDDSISLTLDPGELGRVEVAISRGAEAHVSLRAERPETLALLQRDRAELERALAGTGFGAEGRAPNLSFGLGFGGNGEDRRDRRPAARDGQGARPASPTPAIPTHQAAPTARGLIDLAF